MSVVYKPRLGYDPDQVPDIEMEFRGRAGETQVTLWWRPCGSTEPWRGPVAHDDPEVPALLKRAGFERTV